MHAVVFDFQRLYPGSLAFSQFQCQQKIAAVFPDCAQLIQFGIVTVVDDTAVIQDISRLGKNGRFEQITYLGARGELC